MKKIIVHIVFVCVVLMPFILWFVWNLSASKKLNILIMDKSVSDQNYNEHAALNWILLQNKIVKNDGKLYDVEKDYFGIFPLANQKNCIKDLSAYNEKQLDSLCNVYQMVYYADAYGVYENNDKWQNTVSDYSIKKYGGLDEKDYLFLKKTKEKQKLIMAEFNFFAYPTSDEIRNKIEKLFCLHWTGWIGRYFEKLDTIDNSDFPKWIVKLYKKQNHGKWSFLKAGIVFVNNDKTIVILEQDKHLKSSLPLVKSNPYGVDKFSIPSEIAYPYWFDITLSNDSNNKIISNYEINTNSTGDAMLNQYQIPKFFPAVYENLKNNKFYYCCGDYGDSPVNTTFAKFKGIRKIETLFSHFDRIGNRRSFFLKYYLPFIEKILLDEVSKH